MSSVFCVFVGCLFVSRYKNFSMPALKCSGCVGHFCFQGKFDFGCGTSHSLAAILQSIGFLVHVMGNKQPQVGVSKGGVQFSPLGRYHRTVAPKIRQKGGQFRSCHDNQRLHGRHSNWSVIDLWAPRQVSPAGQAHIYVVTCVLWDPPPLLTRLSLTGRVQCWFACAALGACRHALRAVSVGYNVWFFFARKSDTSWEKLQQLSDGLHNNVDFPVYRSFKSTWGSFLIMRAELEGFEELIRMGVWDFAFVLSASDLPIRNVDDMGRMLAPFRGEQIIFPRAH